MGIPSAWNPGGSNPGGETPDLAVDGSLTTKWLDFNQGPLIFDFGSAATVDGYRWATANDATERDPVRWTLEGSDDETNWVLVDERVDADFPTPVARFTYTSILELNAAPQVSSFTVDRPLISAGLPVTLSWEIDPASTDVSIDQGVGSVLGMTTNGVGSITLDPGPTATTVYEITANHANGDSAAQVVVTVTNLPVIHEFIATPAIGGPGDKATLSWEVFNADNLVLDGVAVTGTSLVKVLTTSQTFILMATNGNGASTKSVSAKVVEPGVPVINEFMARW